MDALNFLKLWRNVTMATTTTSTAIPHLVVDSDGESDEEDSFFDLELTLHDPQNQKPKTENSEVEVPKKTERSLSPNEPISKRKVLPIEPISKPQSPIALLKSAPSFRIFTFRKHKKIETEKTEDSAKTGCVIDKNQKKEAKVFAVKLSLKEHWNISSPTLSRVNSSTRGFGSKIRSNNGSEEQPKTERFSKEALQKYLKMIKPLYVKVSKRYGEKVRFSGEASPSSSPSVASVSSRKERQGSFPAGMRVVSRHLGKSRSSPAAVGVSSPANRSDDTLLLQHDGIQSAILHCKRSFNSRDSSIGLCEEGSVHSVRSSFEDENGARV